MELTAKFKRLTLQIERDLLTQSRFRVLLTTADNTLAGHRQELRLVRADMRRRGRVK